MFCLAFFHLAANRRPRQELILRHASRTKHIDFQQVRFQQLVASLNHFLTVP